MATTFQALLRADATREQLEDWCRSRAQHYVSGDYLVCRVLGKYLLWVHQRDTALTPHLVLDGIWEPWITMAIARHVKPGMRCMDVGACYGYYTMLLADLVGSSGYVEAWEPVWGEKIVMAAAANGVADANLSVQKVAIGTNLGLQLGFALPPKNFNAGDVLLVPDGTGADGYTYVGAPPAERYDFIKIDVEGAEVDVWRALEGVRRESPSLVVCMEFTPEKHENPDHFLLALAKDFDVGTVGHDGIPRRIELDEALKPDTGAFRMLWLTSKSSP